MYTLLKICAQIVIGFGLCWFIAYLLLAFPQGVTPVDVLTSWQDPNGGFFVVLWPSLILYGVFCVLYIFIRSYKQ